MPLPVDEIKKLIKESIPDAIIEIKDLMGDNNHYSATIKSKLFNNLNKIEQHKLVYKSLRGKMGNELHALSITTDLLNSAKLNESKFLGLIKIPPSLTSKL